MNALTIAEIRLRHAQLTHSAERMRQEGRTLSATTMRASFLAKAARQTQQRADDYASLLRIAEAEESK